MAGHVALEAQANGDLVVSFSGYALGLGKLSAGAAARAQELRTGLAFAAFSGGRPVDKEVDALIRRLARRGLLEYALRRDPGEADQVVIEPQVAEYWPRTPPLGAADILALSRFAYLRRRGTELVLESPRAGALFRIGDPHIAAGLALLAAPRSVGWLRRQGGFPALELLALLLDCDMLIKVDAGRSGLRPEEGDGHLALWDFHDLLFHARSTEGRHANPIGGLYSYAHVMPPLPAVRPGWSGKTIDLRAFSDAAPPASPAAKLVRERHSTRSFDPQRPITLAELARFLDSTARVTATWQVDPDDIGGPPLTYARRPYPSAGASWELELYLAVDACDGLAKGFYHYDAGAHVLVPIETRPQDLDALLTGAAFAMDAPGAPQILMTISARFGRVAWKYSQLAYALMLKDAGVLTQTLYLMAADMGLGGCAIGSVNVDLFAKMTGIDFHVEGPVGQFALGRPGAEPT
ncbi:MAG TPA: SagB family peptide dehydrogenase [Xanthobacteraceae bacterium]|nr:SagB family peptide dehydrogenase [Xanthobacteraceae bacterium]